MSDWKGWHDAHDAENWSKEQEHRHPSSSAGYPAGGHSVAWGAMMLILIATGVVVLALTGSFTL
jgi:hypothetical protein